MADNKLISSVYDIPDWMAENFPSVTGPLRTAGNVARLPLDVGADLLRKGTYGAFGLEEEGPFKYSRERMGNIRGALSDSARPYEAMAGGANNAWEGLREKMIAAGGKPQAEPISAQIPGEFGAPAPAARPAPIVRAPRPPVIVDQTGAPNTTRGSRNMAPGGIDAELRAGAPSTMASMGALEGPTPEAPRPSLMAQFKERMAAIPVAKGEVSEQEKKQRQLEFFLNMLARNKGGSTFLQNAAGAGLDTSAGMRADLEKAQARAEAGRKAAREDVFREIGFGDKDEDNRRGDKREDTRLKILQRQIDDGKWKVMDNGKSGTYVLLDVRTDQTKDTGIKVPRDTKDTRAAEVQLLDYLKKNPGDIETLLKIKGKDKDDDAYKVFDAAVKRVTGDVMGTTNMDTAVQEARRGLETAKGGRPMLPKGVPPGSKQVGTSGGKPVYEAPDGKRYKTE